MDELRAYKMLYKDYTFFYSNGMASDFKDGRVARDTRLENEHEYYCLVNVISRLVLIIVPVEELT